MYLSHAYNVFVTLEQRICHLTTTYLSPDNNVFVTYDNRDHFGAKRYLILTSEEVRHAYTNQQTDVSQSTAFQFIESFL